LAACGLNLLLPGAGYVYGGRILKGIIVFPIFLLLAFFSSGVGALFLWAIITIDTVMLVNRYNEKLDATTKKTCPECAEMVHKEARICKHCRHEFGG
jgi:TM2 domain-containing membrane protein YozV